MFNVSDIVICGDLLHVSAPPPIVVNAVFDFLSVLSQAAGRVHVLCGNHDMDARSYEGRQYTLLSICDRIPGIYYRDDEIVYFGSRRGYCLGYRDNWVDVARQRMRSEGPIDIVFGHVMPYGVKIGHDDLVLSHGQDLSKIDCLMFVGDIHRHQTLYQGRVVVPGCPIQNSFNDPEKPGFIILNPQNLKWVRHETETPKWKFLKFSRNEQANDDPYTIFRPVRDTKTANVQKQVEHNLHVFKTIDEVIEHESLQDVHAKILGEVSKEARQGVDLTFSLRRLRIENFRSISHFVWNDIDNKGVIIISGQNGTGKSSLISAILFALTGEGAARNFIQRGKASMSVEIDLVYGNHAHTICREWTRSGGKLHYLINHEQQPAENQR